jgi:Trk-type K+ transport system membrane component
MLLGGIGFVICLVGAVWIGQGVGAIHGSFMTGNPTWAVLGVVLLAIGITMMAWTARRGRRRGT